MPKKESSADSTRSIVSFAGGRGGEITLHQLRIFSAVARSESLTKAAKLIGLAQPSLSQQLAKLEGVVGCRLIDRTSHQMTLTDAGHYLLRKAEQVLKGVQEAEEGLAEYGEGNRISIRIAGINSVLRGILPLAMVRLQQDFPHLEFDVFESTPSETLELLYGRHVNIGLVAANTIAKSGSGFVQLPIVVDPYVLAVPESLDLTRDKGGYDSLSAGDKDVLNRVVQFNFGNYHTHRVQAWYDTHIPDHRTIAQCRSFEVALGMVRAGLGVCLAPALAALNGTDPIPGVTLYRVPEPDRMIVALVASQYRFREPYAALLEALQVVGRQHVMPTILEAPSIFRAAMRLEDA